jgi:Flp pilus assembly protein TadG
MKSMIARHHRGAVVLMFGLMLPVFIGFAALSVDVSMIAVARGQLSRAADAAALAGAQSLVSEDLVRGATDASSLISTANTQAISFAQRNPVLGSTPVLSSNLYNDSTGDVLVGYLDVTNPSSTLNTDSSASNLFNSVQVTMKRDATHGGLVPTIFGGLMGFRGASVKVSSTATAQAYSVSGFKANGSQSANLLPIVLDKDTWKAMMSKATIDDYSYDPNTNTITSGTGDGVCESQLYPVKNGSPGNWGTINVGVSNNSTSTLGDQIRYGITPAQLATFPNSTIELDSSLTPPSYTFSGDPGISAGIKDDLAAIIGKPVTIPIYDLNGGNGNNAWYRVIAFQPCRIVSVSFKGNPKYVIIQPCLINDSCAVTGSAQSWTSGGQVGLYLSR